MDFKGYMDMVTFLWANVDDSPPSAEAEGEEGEEAAPVELSEAERERAELIADVRKVYEAATARFLRESDPARAAKQALLSQLLEAPRPPATFSTADVMERLDRDRQSAEEQAVPMEATAPIDRNICPNFTGYGVRRPHKQATPPHNSPVPGKDMGSFMSCSDRECMSPFGKHTTWDSENYQDRVGLYVNGTMPRRQGAYSGRSGGYRR